MSYFPTPIFACAAGRWHISSTGVGSNSVLFVGPIQIDASLGAVFFARPCKQNTYALPTLGAASEQCQTEVQGLIRSTAYIIVFVC